MTIAQVWRRQWRKWLATKKSAPSRLASTRLEVQQLEDRLAPTNSISFTAPSGYSEPTSVRESAGSVGVYVLLTVGTDPGDTTGTYAVTATTSNGTATAGTDYTAVNSTFSLSPLGSGVRHTVPITILDDGASDGDETLTITLSNPGNGAVLSSPTTLTITIIDDHGADLPPPVIDPGCNCGCPPGPVQTCGDAKPAALSASSGQPVRYFDGVVTVNAGDLFAGGFGEPWGYNRAWTNGAGYAATANNGSGWVDLQQPYLLRSADANTIAVITSGTTAIYFDLVGGAYQARYYNLEQLSYDASGGQFTLVDTAGDKLRFYDFSATYAAGQRGQFKDYTDAYGNTVSVTSHDAGGRITEVQRSVTAGGNTTTESFLYTYLTSGANSGLLSNLTLRRKVNSGAWTTIRQVDYTYYDGVESYGNAGDLKKAIIKDAGGNALSTDYYRLYVSESGGYTHGLKYVFSGPSYARLVTAIGGDPSSSTDATVAPYADKYFEYDSSQRVTKEIAQGAGCSACAGGLGTFTFSYTTSSNALGFNSWNTRTVETLPDGNQNIVYTNGYGQVMLKIFHDTTSGLSWITFAEYDGAGRVILLGDPSAVTGYDDTKADLLNSVLGHYQFLSATAGLITSISYYTSTTATSSTAGGASGYFKEIDLLHGALGTAVPQSLVDYIANIAGSVTIYLPAHQTVYRNSDGTGGETTALAYTFFSGSNGIQSTTITQPTVTAAENGPGTADSEITFNDSFGRPIWVQDGGGFLHYTEYDSVTGAVTKTIVDVDTTQTSDFSNLPSGWSTPAGGGLHLITRYQVDALGRPTKITDPNGNITYIVYDDPNHAMRVYAGWDTGTSAPTGPTEVVRDDWADSYAETLTMSATPHLTGGVPDGSEAIGSVQTDTRQSLNSAGQVVSEDRYFDLTSLAYTTSATFGTLGTNFYRTQFAYAQRGWENRVVTPTGTIERTVYDGLGRPISDWVGTNDTPATGYWSPSNPAGMVKVRDYVYDGGGVGDGNLTAFIDYPGLGAAPRETDKFYDWRDRLVARKAGVQAAMTEMNSMDVNRLLVYQVLDNLGEVIATEQYKGDGVTIADANGDGVPDKPSASLLRARATASYDEQGRVYRTNVFDVNPMTGAVSTNSLQSDLFFDHRGQVIKSTAPGGLSTKLAHDGAGRIVKIYVVDASGDTSWSDAGNVTGDAVLQQTENTLDADGNVTETIVRRRFDSETGTGALGTPTTGVTARVSYAGMYYDKADRLTATVSVGTNGGSAWTMPASVPARSDTVLVMSQTYNAAGWVQDLTDPRGLVTDNQYDNLGEVTQTVEAYDGGAITDSTNKTTQFVYDGSGHVVTLTALLTGGAQQQTKFNYGVTIAAGSAIDSKDLLASVDHPDKSTGSASSSERDLYTVNALGQNVTFQDRNGTQHGYAFDVLGRLASDAVTTLGAGVDGTVRRIDTGYDAQGNPSLFTSYALVQGGVALNQVRRDFNGLGQLSAEWQSHLGPVTPATPEVQYVFSEMAGGANHSRLTKLLYPNGREVDYTYASGVDDHISRLTSLSDSTGTLESFAHLGLDTVVKRAHPQPGVDLTYIKQAAESNGDAGDKYIGLDRFDRVVDQRWLATATATATDRFQYSLDRDGNRMYRDNLVNAAFGELYHANGASAGYDSLNQLTDFARGTLSASVVGGTLDTVTSPSRSQSWSLDAVGNFKSQATDSTTVTRTHNKQNEVTGVGSATLTFDANGNMTKDESGKSLFYDAWNRLVLVKDSSGNIIVGYACDALGRRITETPLSGIPPASALDLYYSSEWQVLEERAAGSASAQTQYTWSPVYIDALILRDVYPVGTGQAQRLWVQQDANWNVTALLDSSGTVVERDVYDPYGKVTVLDASWGTRTSSLFGWQYFHQGGRFDAAAGLYDFRNRDYSPTLGRWISQDPLSFGAGDSNLYRFVGNRPAALNDPSGEFFWVPFLIGAAFFAGGTGGLHMAASDYNAAADLNANVPSPENDALVNAQANRAQWWEAGSWTSIYFGGGMMAGPVAGEVAAMGPIGSGVVTFGGQVGVVGTGVQIVETPWADLNAPQLVEAGGSVIAPWAGGYAGFRMHSASGSVRPGPSPPPSVSGPGFFSRIRGLWNSLWGPTPRRINPNITRGLPNLEAPSRIGSGTLTAAEHAEIQLISNRYHTTIDVVGSRAAGEGRNIGTDLPVGRGPGTRSDIDFRIDTTHPRAAQLMQDLLTAAQAAQLFLP